ncbi:MAG: FAD-dependent oxidoreductase [Bifidobacteriaceae bacterium]|jgi:prenylcysteine oxidase/farnesylcysteine lyase|nr:FAD-dependent oxidoreductase [Bifidobacteriaceae bacterium]
MYKIAIIGGGAAGAGAAWRLHQSFGQDAQITVFERAEHVGGRTWDLTLDGCHMEVGGVLLHSTGQITKALMEFTGSQEAVPSLSIDGKDETYAFWTDRGFPVLTKVSLASMAFGILKYVGAPSALKVTRRAIKMAAQYEGVYTNLRDHAPFTTPDELFDALGLLAPTKISAAEYFKQLKVNDRMARDVVEAITHNMYNQGLEMNALACLVGLAGAGLAGGHLFVIEGGNWTLFDKMLRKAKIDLRVNTKVVQVSLERSAGTALPYTCQLQAEGGLSEQFDAVVLAAPPALADLTVTVDGRPFPLRTHPYQEVQTTLVVGELNPAYFGRRPGQRMPSTVFTAASAPAPFKSIGTTGWSPEFNSRIYKIFSADHVMTEAELHAIFATIHDVHTHPWRGAYPVLTPALEHLPFELHPGLYFANALETIAGSIEVEAVSGTNAANLCAHYLQAHSAA